LDIKKRLNGFKIKKKQPCQKLDGYSPAFAEKDKKYTL